jgi:hypothetical protein
MKSKNDRGKYRVKIFVDIDGVLADWNWGVHTLLGLSHINTQNYHIHKENYSNEYYDAVRRYQSTGGEFWYDLIELPKTQMLWEFVSRYKHAIITAIGSRNFNAESQKRRWALRHLGEELVYVVERTKEKYTFAEPRHILIDDQQRALDGWIEHGGLGILHQDVESTIEKLSELVTCLLT